jgi:translation elongation factor EF-1beta
MRIIAVIEDEKISVDDITEKMEEGENISNVSIHSFNRL